jgi:predicted AAA+ superfamily ATPase
MKIHQLSVDWHGKALEDLRGTVAIDEIQHRSDLFPILRVLADRKPLPARFLILGSASPELLRQSSESLAGRLETIPVAGLGLAEVGAKMLNRHWKRGGFPLSFLARTNEDSATWRGQFIQTFLERDVPQLGINIPAPACGSGRWSPTATAGSGALRTRRDRWE